eukprot:1824748-Pleurochrysis_carterae.AAC.1
MAREFGMEKIAVSAALVSRQSWSHYNPSDSKILLRHPHDRVVRRPTVEERDRGAINAFSVLWKDAAERESRPIFGERLFKTLSVVGRDDNVQSTVTGVAVPGKPPSVRKGVVGQAQMNANPVKDRGHVEKLGPWP